jgi:RimJ/RimL family protein N-acetyltransferase
LIGTKEHRGQGLSKPVLCAGTDFAFEVLNMNRIDGEILENNVASIKSAEYAGFKHEGIRRKSIHKCGEYLNSIHIGILKEDWVNLERIKQYGGICNISYQPKNDM